MSTAAKTNWADDVDETEVLPAKTETVGSDGVTTIVEWKFNDDGKKVKITRKIKRTLSKQQVSHVVAERKSWAKFGAERGNPAGPQNATTTVGENMQFKLGVGKATEEVKEAEDDPKNALKAKKIVCRLCKGDHFTSKCPYKETLEGLGPDTSETPDFGAEPTPAEAAAPASTGGKYVPPSMRGARAGQPSADSRYPGGGGGGGSREDLPTLRVTNVSDDVEEDDLRELFEQAIRGTHGRVARVYIGKDRETGVKKGYAFVSFDTREVAQRAIDKVHGQGYANLILNVAFSTPRTPKDA
ncbi:translation initiation factor 3 rna-binding subunit [Phaffia rhodozyma]|uniref:Eukaryotic translation initiation factor 3 subunit G n=1 Tax=Phaffia rhodozyma TaxID=264483 RepID=A0A0F7SGP7_PHARH|nr:translation initiation factor 3 rna-binding subunit [Phaffia rhodozyma]